MDKKAHNSIMCPVVREGFLPQGIELDLIGLDGFIRHMCEEGLPEKMREAKCGS